MKRFLKISLVFLSLALIITLASCNLISLVEKTTENTVEVSDIDQEVIDEIANVVDEVIAENSSEITEVIIEDDSENDTITFESSSSNSTTSEETSTEIDFFTLTNLIETEVIKANVRIECAMYYQSRGRYQQVMSTIGSGVIIKEVTSRGKTYYYCLTNNHVVYNPYSYATYVVEDVYENEYDATLLYSLNTYDLALLRFSSDEDLYVVELSDNLNYEGYVAAIGEANAKSNTLTYGYITGSETFEPDESTKEESYVTFDVITHTAFIESGSSGGALLDMNLNLIGINFASRLDKDGSWDYSYAIPLSQILEFLDLCYTNIGFSL